ncbi:MAG TPA: ABC transporter permease [Thermoanaerobaculia bacterium]
MSNLIQDLQYGLRALARKPRFTIVMVLTLALGIGANAGVFTLVNSVLLRPLPLAEPDRVAIVYERNLPRGQDRNVVSALNFDAWRTRSESFASLAAVAYDNFIVTGEDAPPEKISGSLVNAELFAVMGVDPLLGSVFAATDDRPGAGDVAVLRHRFWIRRFGGDPDVIGQPLRLDGKTYTVVGVMPPGYLFPESADVWLPIAFSTEDLEDTGRYLHVLGRLRPGVAVAQAQTEMDLIATQLEETRPESNAGWRTSVIPLAEDLVGEARPALLVLMAAVGFVLLIACANVAHLLFVQSADRFKEMAIRSAMGASRRRIVRQLLTENGLLVLAGGILGVVLAYFAVDFLIGVGSELVPPERGVVVDARVLLFTLAVLVATALLCGAAPALRLSRTREVSTLKEGGRGTSRDRGTQRIYKSLVVTEMALALVVLIGAGLMLRSFQELRRVDFGFDAENLLVVPFSLPSFDYPDVERKEAFFHEVRGRLESLPGVRSVSAVNYLPPTWPAPASSFSIEGRPQPPSGEEPVADFRVVMPGYFETMGIAMLQGRDVTADDIPDKPFVAVVNKTMADSFWPGGNAIGQRFEILDEVVEVVGVSADVIHRGIRLEARPLVYFAYAQNRSGYARLLVRCDGEAAQQIPAIRSQVWAVDKNVPLDGIELMTQRLAGLAKESRARSVLLGAFAVVAVLLASMGIFSVMASAVAGRVQELGIRLALGAPRTSVLKMIMSEGLRLALTGVALGVAGSLALTRFMSSLLYGITAHDPATFALVALLALAVAISASYLPARRATRVEPIQVLRYE